MKKQRRPPVLIEWSDSCSYGRQIWRSLDEAKELAPSRIRSVGFLLFESKDRVTITGHISDEDDESGAFTIPRGCITKMIRLGSGK